MAEMAENRIFGGQMAIFGVFREIRKSVFRRLFYGCRNFDGEIFRKKIMCLVDIINKYLKLTLITYENIQKVNLDIFFDLKVVCF